MIDAARWDTSAGAAFVELHVEQGPVLDAEGLDLGVVLGITGRQAVDIELVGAANHAGTTPMHLRHDALAAAAEIVLAVEALGRDGVVLGITGRQAVDIELVGAANHAGTTPMHLRHDALAAAAEVVLAVEELGRDGVVRVATCGHLQVTPNVRNVVPGRVRLSAELRADDLAQLTACRPAVEALVEDVGRRRGVQATLTWGQLVPPIAADPAVLDVLRAAAERSGRPWTELWSGAGHDAQILAPHVPTAMVFVPSVAGISHAPEERTWPEHLVAGAQLLADALLALGEVAA